MNVRLLTIDEVIEFIKQGKASDIWVVEKEGIFNKCYFDNVLKRLDKVTVSVLNEFDTYLFLLIEETARLRVAFFDENGLFVEENKNEF